jgi:hypothetical protein
MSLFLYPVSIQIPNSVAVQTQSSTAVMHRTMTKTDVNYWLDGLLLALFCLLCWASVVVRFVFPPGPEAAGWRLWGWDYEQWASFQFTLLCILASAIVLHVMLHWSWVCGVTTIKFKKRQAGSGTTRDDASRTLWGVGLLIVIFNVLGLAIAVAALTVEAPL